MYNILNVRHDKLITRGRYLLLSLMNPVVVGIVFSNSEAKIIMKRIELNLVRS